MSMLPLDRDSRGHFRPLRPEERARIVDLYRAGVRDPDKIVLFSGLPIARKTVINLLNKEGIFLRRRRERKEDPPPIQPMGKPPVTTISVLQVIRVQKTFHNGTMLVTQSEYYSADSGELLFKTP